jgi:Zn-dependent protease with chaperone function
MERACWQGGLALLFAWGITRALPRLSPAGRCWLWRLAFLKLLVALAWATPVHLPLLPPTPTPRPDPRPHFHSHPPPTPPTSHAPLLLGLWFVGAAWSGVRLVRESREGRRLRARAAALPDGWLARRLEELGVALGLDPARGVPRLLVAPGAGSPLLVGMRRPAIIVPAGLLAACDTRELQLMLAHELGHLKRRDLLWNWLPAAAHALCYFHPLVWIASREWHLAQEMACDELAVRATAAPAADYGQLLLRVAARRGARRHPALASFAAGESPGILKRRLAAVLAFRPGASPSTLAGGLVALAAVTGVLPWRLVAASSPAPPRAVRPALARAVAAPAPAAARRAMPRRAMPRPAGHFGTAITVPEPALRPTVAAAAPLPASLPDDAVTAPAHALAPAGMRGDAAPPPLARPAPAAGAFPPPSGPAPAAPGPPRGPAPPDPDGGRSAAPTAPAPTAWAPVGPTDPGHFARAAGGGSFGAFGGGFVMMGGAGGAGGAGGTGGAGGAGGAGGGFNGFAFGSGPGGGGAIGFRVGYGWVGGPRMGRVLVPPAFR